MENERPGYRNNASIGAKMKKKIEIISQLNRGRSGSDHNSEGMKGWKKTVNARGYQPRKLMACALNDSN